MLFEHHQYYNCEVTTDQNQTYKISAQWLHNQDLDHWQGWHCAAGQLRLFIDDNFEVWSGECQNDSLGNALTHWQPLTQPTVCVKTQCSGCTDDLMTLKYNPKIHHENCHKLQGSDN